MIDVDPLALELTEKGVVKNATAGEPRHAGAVVADQDALRVGVWRCAPGEFPWPHAYAETFTILEGAGTIVDADGQEREIAPGRVFFMPAGSVSVWRITETVRKVYVVPAAN